MSGHKWSKIKHKKAASDAQKSKVFGKLARLIAVESKKAGGNVDSPSLKTAIEKAKSANMPSDNIDRAIAKGKSSEGADMETVTYEAYGPGGVAIIIQGLTDNRNKTASEVKHTLSKNGLALAEMGAASWAFSKDDSGNYVAQTTIDISDEDLSKLESVVEELEENEEIQEVYTNAV